MKKFNSTKGIKGTLMVCASVLLSAGMWSCSDNSINGNGENLENATEQIVGANVNIRTESAFLDKYVTNFKDLSGSRHSRTHHEWSMPDLSALTPDYTIGVSQNIDWNAGGNYVVPQGSTANMGWVTLNSNKGYSNLVIYGEAVIDGINMNGKAAIYVAPGGKLTLRSADCLNTSNKSLYLYAGSEYVGSYKVQNGASIYVEGDLNADGAQQCGGWWYAGGEITVNGALTTDNARIVAPCLTVKGDWYDQNNASDIDIDHFIEVSGNCTFRCQSVIYAQCLLVEKKMEITNAVNLNIEQYISTGETAILASGWHINMGGGALFDCGSKLFINQNGGVNIHFANDKNSVSVIKAKEIQGNVQNFNNIPSLDFMCISGYADLQYEKINPNCKQILSQETLTENGGVNIAADPDGCRPAAQGIGGGENPPLPPYISEVIAHIDADHTHDISATCIALHNGKSYISWHKRGTSVHGCIEALSVENDMARLTSWMETDGGASQGGNNWDGNSAVSGADDLGQVQGEYDFNHIIVVNEGGVNYAVTVGDNASKGGFIGAIALDANGDFGKSSQSTTSFFSRQLLAKAENTGRSGNAVVRTASGKYMIACSGGFQEYQGLISDLGVKCFYENSGSSYWKTVLGDYSLTPGSAKHIALDPSGRYVATLEFTQRSNNVQENDDYWFNDVTTVLPAVVKVRDASNWLSSTLWSVQIDGGISPIYGKNVVAMDAAGKVYVSQGVNGLGIYQNGQLTGSFKISSYDAQLGAMFPGAAVNGLFVDDSYIYLAYGVAGLWILDKNTLQVVSYYTKGCASANYVVSDGKYIYLAYGRNGVNVLRLNK